MKKFLFILLLLILPFQFSWAAASAYCQHENGSASHHFGHHIHQHQADADGSTAKGQGGAAKVHADCGYCHFAPQAPLFSTASKWMVPEGKSFTPFPAIFYSSHIPDGPRRPDRHPVA